jgi:hypothetical protein
MLSAPSRPVGIGKHFCASFSISRVVRTPATSMLRSWAGSRSFTKGKAPALQFWRRAMSGYGKLRTV